MKKDTFKEERKYQKDLFERIKRLIEYKFERSIDLAQKECGETSEYVHDFTRRLINVSQYKKTENTNETK